MNYFSHTRWQKVRWAGIILPRQNGAASRSSENHIHQQQMLVHHQQHVRFLLPDFWWRCPLKSVLINKVLMGIHYSDVMTIFGSFSSHTQIPLDPCLKFQGPPLAQKTFKIQDTLRYLCLYIRLTEFMALLLSVFTWTKMEMFLQWEVSKSKSKSAFTLTARLHWLYFCPSTFANAGRRLQGGYPFSVFPQS